MIARTQKPLSFRPRLVLAYADSAHAALSARHLRRLGWEVHLASSGPDARRLAAALAPEVVILDTQLPDESGWLTCAKLTLSRCEFKVVLLTDVVTPEMEDHADLVGAAALVCRGAALPVLAGEVHDTVLPTAG